MHQKVHSLSAPFAGGVDLLVRLPNASTSFETSRESSVIPMNLSWMLFPMTLGTVPARNVAELGLHAGGIPLWAPVRM